MKSITTNTWFFPQLREDNCVYVDKTDLLLKLIQSNDRSVFISRPRRFGKSLMLSTLQAIFEGRKELFHGLKICDSNYDWKRYPVLMMDMSAAKSISYEETKSALNKLVGNLARGVSLKIAECNDPSQTFVNLWDKIKEKGLQVVVLVDEYDIPLQGYLNKPEEYELTRQLLHDFYLRFKQYAPCIRFLMLTGVTKIAKLSIFSGLNSPTDLSFRKEYASLLGYTHEELTYYFSEHIQAFAAEKKKTPESIYRTLLDWYDHYRFSAESEVCVLNPVSVGYALTTQLFENFWMETGQTSMIIERLKAVGKIPAELDRLPAEKSLLNVSELHSRAINALLYQAGYLTIQGVDENGSLLLGIPNYEVRECLSKEYLQTIISDDSVALVYSHQRRLSNALEKGDLQTALSAFRSALSVYPYEWLEKGKEGAAKVAFLSFFSPLRNVIIHTERQFANGRVDAIVETRENVYIFEFKYDESSQKAFDQILEKGYATPFLHTSKRVYGIGINYNPGSGRRGVDEPVVKEIVNE